MSRCDFISERWVRVSRMLKGLAVVEERDMKGVVVLVEGVRRWLDRAFAVGELCQEVWRWVRRWVAAWVSMLKSVFTRSIANSAGLVYRGILGIAC